MSGADASGSLTFPTVLPVTVHRPPPLAILAVALAATALAGCAKPLEGGPPGDPTQAATALEATNCRITLNVWLVPQSELAQKVPPEFPPTAYRGDAPADTPLARIVFYLYDCADGAARSTLGLLAARVDAPPNVAPPSNGSAMYIMGAWAEGAPALALDTASIAHEHAQGVVDIKWPSAGVATATATVTSEDGAVQFRASAQSLPGQVETFARPERYYLANGSGVRWADVAFNTTLYEGQGRVEYPDGSPWAAAVGRRAYDAGIDHHVMVGNYTLVTGNAPIDGR